MPSPRRYLDAARATAREAARWRRSGVSSTDAYLALRGAHRATSGRSSQLARAVLRRAPGAADRAGPVALSEWEAAIVQALRHDGIAEVDPVLEPDEVEALRAFARRAPAQVRHDDGRTTPGTYEDRSPDATAVHVDGAFAWARPEVQALLVEPRLRRLVAAATGFRPVLHPPQLYWTIARPDDAGDGDRSLARGFHWDFDGIAGVRLHVHLTDVDSGAGPMEYVAGSHRPGALGWRRPGSIDQYADDAARRFPPSAVRPLLGPPGSSFLTDPHGLHRATRPTVTDRLFLVLPIQGGGVGSYYHRQRAVPVRHADLQAQLDRRDPALRLFVAAPPDAVAATLRIP